MSTSNDLSTNDLSRNDLPKAEGDTAPSDNAFRRRLARQFQDRDFRETYDDDFLNTSIATQLSVLRQQRRLSQAELAELSGTRQPAISRLENVNHSNWNVKTLGRVAHALGVRMRISFETYGSLIEEAESFSRRDLERPGFEDDPLIRLWTAPVDSAIARLEHAGDPRSWMERLVVPWLEKTDWTEQRDQLADWIRGRGLPPVGSDEEPYAWLLEGIPLGSDRPARQRRLAELLARFIAEKPDVNLRYPEKDDALYNLFLLSAGTDFGEILADPLETVLDRLKGSENQLDLRARDGLLAALIRTQTDQRHYAIWRTMLQTGSHHLLPGDEYAGFSGVKWMPESREQLGKPYFPAIADAISLMTSRYLDGFDEKRREEELEALYTQVLRLYNGSEAMLAELREHLGKIPSWAMKLVQKNVRYVRLQLILAQSGTNNKIKAEVRDRAEGSILYEPVTLNADTNSLAEAFRQSAPRCEGTTRRSFEGTVRTAYHLIPGHQLKPLVVRAAGAGRS